jgi:hypothetical protein
MTGLTAYNAREIAPFVMNFHAFSVALAMYYQKISYAPKSPFVKEPNI